MYILKMFISLTNNNMNTLEYLRQISGMTYTEVARIADGGLHLNYYNKLFRGDESFTSYRMSSKTFKEYRSLVNKMMSRLNIRKEYRYCGEEKHIRKGTVAKWNTSMGMYEIKLEGGSMFITLPHVVGSSSWVSNAGALDGIVQIGERFYTLEKPLGEVYTKDMEFDSVLQQLANSGMVWKDKKDRDAFMDKLSQIHIAQSFISK